MTTGGAGVVVGVDGGGTTTDVLVADLAGEVLATVRTGGTNHESIGVDAVVAVLTAALDEALAFADRERSDVVGSVFGLAGVDWPGDVERIDAALATLGLGGDRSVVNDSVVALRAGCARPWGIVSSVGTGSVTAGRGRAGQWFRTMAVGFGEPSGSGTLVSDALHAIAAHHHGIAEPTALTDRLLAELGHRDVPAMFEAITRGRAGGLRRCAPAVTEVAASGDGVARHIVADVARRHVESVVGVARHLDLVDDEFELVTAGAVHAAGGLFTEVFSAGVAAALPGAALAPLAVSPAHGAISIALESR